MMEHRCFGYVLFTYGLVVLFLSIDGLVVLFFYGLVVFLCFIYLGFGCVVFLFIIVPCL